MRFRILKKLEDGRLEATATDWPSFLYDDSALDSENPDPNTLLWNETDIENGLLRGYFLLRVSFFSAYMYLLTNLVQCYMHIYSGPSVAAQSALNDKHPPRAAV